MSELRAWLDTLGLADYAPLFDARGLDLGAVLTLTHRELVEVGLPEAPCAAVMARTRHTPGSSGPIANESVCAPASGRLGQVYPPEMRQLTVVFLEITDSALMAGDLELEDLQQRMSCYQRLCFEPIVANGGHVAQFLGDSVVAYFGWPEAREYAAEAATRAALDVVRAVGISGNKIGLSARAGISTGRCLVGEHSAGVSPLSASAVGQAPNLAARLLVLAPPNAVLVSGETYRLSSGRVAARSLGLHTVRGIRNPVPVFQAIQVRDDASRFAASPRRVIDRSQLKALPDAEEILTPLVGRVQELGFLRRRVDEAFSGEGRVVFLSGVSGVGKSRLVHELERVIQTPHVFLRLQCLPHGARSPLFPVIMKLGRICRVRGRGFKAGRPPAIDRLLRSAVEDTTAFTRELMALLSVHSGASPLTPGSSTQVRKQHLALLVNLVLEMARIKPVFCIVEDAHWIDPTSQELLDQLVSRIDDQRVMLIVTHRPEYRMSPKLDLKTSVLSIPRLCPDAAEAMVRSMVTGAPPSARILARILELSDSIPLFVEEIVRSFMDAGRAEQFACGTRMFELPEAVPATLRDSLVARLDRAPRGRGIAQIGAVLGREFAFDVLRDLAAIPDHDLISALAELQAEGILHQVRGSPQRLLAFKHALLRDTAYELLPRSVRQQLHRRVVDYMEALEDLEAVCEVEAMALHCQAAGDGFKAAEYWVRGAERAISIHANHEAESQLMAAVRCVSTLSPSLKRDGLELRAQLLLGQNRVAMHGYASLQTRAAFERAHLLSHAVPGSGSVSAALSGLWGHYWMVGQHDRALAMAHMLLKQARVSGDPRDEVMARRALGSSILMLGDFLEARKHLAIAAHQDPGMWPGESFAIHPSIAARLLLGWTLWMLGFPDAALFDVRAALGAAQGIGHPYTVASAHFMASMVHTLREEFDEALDHADKSLVLSRQHDLKHYRIYSSVVRGCALAGLGRRTEGLALIREGLKVTRQSNLRHMQGFMLAWLAHVSLEAGDIIGARMALDEAFSNFGAAAENVWVAELHRLYGELLMAENSPATRSAEDAFLAALDLARRQAAKTIEMRAAVSLARLYGKTGRADQGIELLDSVLSGWHEGFGAPAVCRASTLQSLLALER
ncbi:MAG: AAA family ATPase [Betaproteobacteria bacterium]